MRFPDTIAPLSLTSTEATAQGYAALTQDWNPIHLDAEFAAATPFGRPIAHGTMALNLLMQAISAATGGRAVVSDLSIRFTAPTFVGQTLTATGTATDGTRYDVWVETEDGRKVLSGHAVLAERGAS